MTYLRSSDFICVQNIFALIFLRVLRAFVVKKAFA